MPAPRGPGRAAARALAAWYRDHARDLPWRRSPGPYQVLVSEIMLQQTTVEAVIPYYRRFVDRYPDLRALAEAREEDLLALWSGLGYYRRARSLRWAAEAIVSRHGGRMPDERENLLALPGIGPYTAAAIMAIAHGREAVALDGNLKRVLARLSGWEESVEDAAGRRALEEAGLALVRGSEPGVINQALMDLGASLCAPRAPRCSACPLDAHCRARHAGTAERIPPPRRRPEPVEVRLAAAVVARDGALLMRRRSGRLMAGLWEFPMVEMGRGREPDRGDGADLLSRQIRKAGLKSGPLVPLGRVSHTITRHRIRVALFAAEASGRPSTPPARAAAEPQGRSADLAGEGDGPLQWVKAGRLEGMALTGLARKIFRRRRGVRPPGSGRRASAR